MLFFDIEQNKSRLLSILEGWRGVPYLHMGTSKGGVDCTKFVGLLLVELGILSYVEESLYYPNDWFLHGKEENLITSFVRHVETYGNQSFSVNLIKVGKPESFDFKFGDVLCFATATELCNHSGILVDSGFFWQCVQRSGCCKSQFLFWRNKVKFIFRTMVK